MSRLPPALTRWEESLAGLSADAVRAMGPLIPLLDELVGRLDQYAGGIGEPDGYDGTTNRGDFERLLMDEWLLAQELPVEFLRRAAEHELTFLRIARRSETPRGRVVVVVDTGPEQLGVPRLVQLAALVVLHRRASESGHELAFVLLGAHQSPARFVSGSDGVAGGGGAAPGFQHIVADGDGLPSALTAWLNARSANVPTPSEVEAAFAVADRDDRVWLLAGPSTRRHAPATHRRSVSSDVVAWDDDGARRLAVRVGDSTAEIEVPDPRAAVASLRGEGLLRRRTDPTVASVPTTGRGAVFHSCDTRLLWRGETDQEIFGCFVAREAKVRRYRFRGSVLAVNSLSKRVVAAVTDGTTLWIEVVGKKLAHTDRIHVPLADLMLDGATLGELIAQPPRPLHLQASQIVVRLPSGWIGLEDQHSWDTGMREVGPSHALDNPHAIYAPSGGFWLGGRQVTDAVAGPLLGPPASGDQSASWIAWSSDSRVWQVARAGQIVEQIAVQEHDRVLGLGLIGQDPFLLVTSESGRIVRQLSPRHVRTLTKFAGPAHFSLHRTRPWLARTTEDRITVGDLHSGETLLEIKASQ